MTPVESNMSQDGNKYMETRHPLPDFYLQNTCKFTARSYNWLQVLGTAERSQMDQRVRHQLPPLVPVLAALKPQAQPLALLFPGPGPFDPPPQGLAGCIEE